MEQNKILFIIGIMTMFSCHSIHKTMESGNGQLSNSEIIQLLTDDSVKYWIGVNFGSSFKFAREGLRFNSYLSSTYKCNFLGADNKWKSHTNLTHPGKYFRPSKVKIMRPTSPK